MNVEREIAGFVAPFAAGVLVTAYAGGSSCVDSPTFSYISFGAIAIALACLLSRNRWRCKGGEVLQRIALWIFISIGAFGSGALSAAADMLQSFEWPASRLEVTAENFAGKMQSAIDSIPFKSQDTGALIKALLTGNRSSLSSAITEAFRSSGASHILALSGMHLGIICLILSKMLSIMGYSITARRCRSCLLILLCGFYTLATGAGASIVRAFLFILLSEIAKLSGRHRSLIQILFAAMLIQLTISPLSALSVSFQLSYAAMAGIAFIFPWLRGFWPETEASTAGGKAIGKAGQRIWTAAALSISCQMTTGPLAYIYFDTIPKHFLLTNLISLPIAGILIPAAALTLCLSALGWCPAFMIQITEALADLLTWALEVISTM